MNEALDHHTQDGKPRRRRKRRNREGATNSAFSAATSGKAKTAKRKRKKPKSGQVSFASLPPGAPMKIPDALKEGRTRKCRITEPTRKVPQRQRRATRAQLAIEPLIASLPDRTMRELRQQWLNVLRRIDTDGETKSLRRFRNAVSAEWERRRRIALADPDRFEWPSTAASPGDGSLRAGQWYSEGMLGYVGYCVGRTRGVGDRIRRQILDHVFGGPLPPLNGPDYIRQWGKPAEASRLKKLAYEIAQFVINAKRKRNADMSSAIADWEDDLQYLHDRYYIGRFGFAWPATPGQE